MSQRGRAKFVISIDVELYWGLHDRRRLDRCRTQLQQARKSSERLLRLFEEFDVRATWACVGFLFCRSRRELVGSLPDNLPAYENVELSPYAHLANVGRDESADPFHFAPSLVDRIAGAPGQEVATHTLTNFHCGAEGQSEEQFEADLRAAIQLGRRHGIMLRSLVFPRSQVRRDYLAACRRAGITAYRGMPAAWPYEAGTEGNKNGLGELARRMGRTIDGVLPLTGTQCVAGEPSTEQRPVEVPATRRLLPATSRRGLRPALHRHRVFMELDAAARRGGLFHLWWPLRDLGIRPNLQLAQVRRILERFDGWRRLERMESATIYDVATGGESSPGIAHRSSSRRTTSP